MMPADQKLYGGWPNCGEIDIMEYLGHELNIVHGTVHYGSPHANNGDKYTLPGGKNFCDDYHVFGLEWLPGEIRFLVDGNIYSTQKYWYSRAPKEPTDFTYPAPFDRNFYMQLNLAVGGNWPGDPDDTTIFPQTMAVDYVRVYKLKGSYPVYQDITYEVTDVTTDARPVLGSGNYIYNSRFDEGKNRLIYWNFNVAKDAAATATVGIKPEERECLIKIKTPGKTPDSVQLVQDRLKIEKGLDFSLKFDARASKERTIQVVLKKAVPGGSSYFLQTVKLTPQMTNYVINFSMTADTADKAELDFNVGDSTEDVILDNINLIKVRKPVAVESETKIEAEDYSEMDGIQTQPCNEGTLNVGWMDEGDFIKYSIDVKKEGNYTFEFRVASTPGGNIRVQLDDKVFFKSDIPPGEWQKWISLTSDKVFLSKGLHNITILGGRFNTNWFKMVPVQ